jgi:hypothetical protein
MPLKSAWKENDELIILAGTRPRVEDAGVDIIDEDGALRLGMCPAGEFLVPKMIGDDDMVGESRGIRSTFFNIFTAVDSPPARNLLPYNSGTISWISRIIRAPVIRGYQAAKTRKSGILWICRIS